jgi:putative acetyltransferase
VRTVHERAFGRPGEADLIARIRAGGGVLLSLVAVIDGRVVGHVLYTPVVLEGGAAPVIGAGLGPLAVLPDRQRTGIGGALVAEGIRRLRERGCPFVVVLGHPAYYPRFGFVPAGRFGVRCPWDVPDEAFMMLPLDGRGAFPGGVATYRHEFSP